MNSRKFTFLPAAMLALPWAVAQAAGPEEGQWRWSISAGATAPTTAVAQHNAVGTVADFGATSGPLAGSGGTVTLNPVRYSDIFGTGWNLGAEVSVGESDALETYARLSYERLPGRSPMVVGKLASATASVPLYAQFGNPKSWELSAGERYYFLAGSKFRPYVGAGIGLARSDSVSATYSAPDAGISFGSGRYFKSSTGFLGDAGAGVQYALTNMLSVTFGIDAQYLTHAKVDGLALSAAGLPAIAASDSHWSYPARLGLSYNF